MLKPKLGIGEHACPGRSWARPRAQHPARATANRARPFSVRSKFSARAREMAPGAGALPRLGQSGRATSIFGSLRHIICLVLLALMLAAPSAHGANDPFAAGLKAETSGQFESAAKCFQQELRRAPSSEAWHNYGNAAWLAGHPGEAVLAWERARWIAPGNTNAAASLRFVANLGQFPELPLTWTETYSAWLSAGQWAWLAASSGWLAVALALLPGIFRRRKSAGPQWLAAAALGVLLLTLPALAGIHSRAQLAVILPANTPLRQTPTLTAQPLARLAAGEMVRCLRPRGAYWFVRTANDETGWVAQNQLGFIAADQLPAWP